MGGFQIVGEAHFRRPPRKRPSLGSGGMPPQKCFAKIAVLRRVFASFGHFYMLYHPFLRLLQLLCGTSHFNSSF